MKKMIALAAMAVMAFTAQAVNYTWTNAGQSTEPNGGNAYMSNFTLTLQATAANGLTSGDKVLLQTITLGLRANVTAPTTDTMIYLGNTSSSVPTDDRTADKLSNVGTTGATIAVSSTRTTNAVTYTFSGSDGKGIELEVGKAYAITIVANNYNKYVSSSNAFPIAEAKGTDQVISRGDADWSPVYEVTAVSVPLPEPTALALLALGVAGMALKRKVR